MRLIVTGTGRSGTGYMARLLTVAGVSCTHEERFGPSGLVLGRAGQPDSSWMAVPYLERYPTVLRVLVHRDPERTIGSLIGSQVFAANTKYRKFLYHHNPRLEGLGAVEAAKRHYVDWHAMALPHVNLVLSLEDLDWEALRVHLPELCVEMPAIDQTFNHRRRQASVTVSDVGSEVRKMHDRLLRADRRRVRTQRAGQRAI